MLRFLSPCHMIAGAGGGGDGVVAAHTALHIVSPNTSQNISSSDQCKGRWRIADCSRKWQQAAGGHNGTCTTLALLLVLNYGSAYKLQLTVRPTHMSTFWQPCKPPAATS
jgi:hypothetical protein